MEKDKKWFGIPHLVEVWFKNKNSSTATYNIIIEDSMVIVDVQGNIVLENLDIVNTEILGHLGIKIRNVTGSITILTELTQLEIYTRIKNFYNKILDECLGKPLAEQEEIIFNKCKKIDDFNRKLKSGLIENSEEYIKNLPDNPTQAQLEYLTLQILEKCLEYCCCCRDEFDVEMKQYANTLKKRIKTIE